MAERLSRSKHFSPLEFEILLELCEDHKAVIENKKTDNQTSVAKESEWEVIATEFNERHGVTPRTPKQLLNAWRNIKSKAKAVLRADNSTKVPEMTPVIEKTLDIIKDQVNSLPYVYVDDAESNDHENDAFNNVSADTSVKILHKAPSEVNGRSGANTFTSTTTCTFTDTTRFCRCAPEPGASSCETTRYYVFLKDLALKEHTLKMENLRLKNDILKFQKRKLVYEASLSSEQSPKMRKPSPKDVNK